MISYDHDTHVLLINHATRAFKVVPKVREWQTSLKHHFNEHELSMLHSLPFTIKLPITAIKHYKTIHYTYIYIYLLLYIFHEHSLPCWANITLVCIAIVASTPFPFASRPQIPALVYNRGERHSRSGLNFCWTLVIFHGLIQVCV